MPVLEAPEIDVGTDLNAPIQNDQVNDDLDQQLVAELLELDLPAEDGIPMETNWHRIEMNLLIDSVHAHWRDRTDYFAGGNMFIYFSLEQVRNKSYRGPDFFVVKNTDGARDRESWVVWLEDGRYPDVIVELASPSTIQTDLGLKKQIYENTFHTTEYFCYDPSSQRLWGWRLTEGIYGEIASNEQGWLWSQELNAWLGRWEGEFQRVDAVWLRLYTAEATLILTQGEEGIRRAEAEHQRAERLAEKLRELGVNPEELE